jgi:hypothetical protein
MPEYITLIPYQDFLSEAYWNFSLFRIFESNKSSSNSLSSPSHWSSALFFINLPSIIAFC